MEEEYFSSVGPRGERERDTRRSITSQNLSHQSRAIFFLPRQIISFFFFSTHGFNMFLRAA